MQNNEGIFQLKSDYLKTVGINSGRFYISTKQVADIDYFKSIDTASKDWGIPVC